MLPLVVVNRLSPTLNPVAAGSSAASFTNEISYFPISTGMGQGELNPAEVYPEARFVKLDFEHNIGNRRPELCFDPKETVV